MRAYVFPATVSEQSSPLAEKMSLFGLRGNRLCRAGRERRETGMRAGLQVEFRQERRGNLLIRKIRNRSGEKKRGFLREYGQCPEKILAAAAGDAKRVAKKHVNPEIFVAAVVKPEKANHWAGTARRGSLFKPVRGSNDFADCDAVAIEIYYD